MKRILIYIVALLLLPVSSCIREIAEYNSYTVDIRVRYGDEIPEEHYDSARVVLNNLIKNYSSTQYTNSGGEVIFHDVEPGFYTVTVTHSFGEGGVAYYLNGLLNLDVFSDVSDTVDVVVSKSNALVIKQYYYSGCLTPAGKQYTSDQFVEIYNNSAVVQYVDGLSIFEHASYALSDNYWAFLKDTIVGRAIWTFPGKGEDYPLLPGHSVVIARDAINHQDDSLGNPLSPVNLEHADFEFWVKTVSGDDIDGPFAVNMIEDLFTYRGNDYVFHTRGGSAIALIRIPGNEEERKDFIKHHLIAKPDIPTRFYGKIPNKFVLDAVEVTWDEAHAIYKRFPVELDAGYTYVPSGSRSGKCVRRKVKEVVNGRYIYQDTNNSTEDFLKDVIPKPWVNEE